MIRLIILTLTLFFMFLFAFINQDVKAQITFLWGGHSQPIPLYFLVIGSFLIGALLAVIMTFPGWVKLKLERRRLERRIERLEGDLDRIRAETEAISTSAHPRRSTGSADFTDDLLEDE